MPVTDQGHVLSCAPAVFARSLERRAGLDQRLILVWNHPLSCFVLRPSTGFAGLLVYLSPSFPREPS
jgi:hypothetical protein